MKIRIGNVLTGQRNLQGGFPQGALLGMLLYVLANNDLEDGFPDVLEIDKYIDDLFILEDVDMILDGRKDIANPPHC